MKTQRLAESRSAQGRTLFEAVLDHVEKAGTVTRRDLLERSRHDGERETVGVLADLVGSGLVHAAGRGADQKLRARGFQIPVGAEHGWESAVFDHFQAVATAIATKLELRSSQSPWASSVGGTTLRFQLTPGHPLRERVLGLLEATRASANALWKEVSAHNSARGIAEDERFDVVFNFGQSVDPGVLGAASPAAPRGAQGDAVR